MEKRFNVTFEELTAEKQREIISSTDEEKILWKGVTSVDLQTRLVTLKNPNTTSEMLEKMLQEARDDEDKLVEAIFKDERLIQTQELITRLRDSHNSEIRQRAAEGIQDASILDEMMKNELKNGKNEYVILSIFSNKNYIRDKKEDIIEAYKQLYGIDEREIFIKSINDDSILDEFIKKEADDNNNYVGYIDADIIVQILNHTMWIPKKYLIKDLVQKAPKKTRIRIAEQITRTDVINMMIAEELLGEKSLGVLEKLIDNSECEIILKEERLIKEASWSVREKMAQKIKDLKFLNKLLLWEIENDNDCDVIMAILENEKFILTAEWQEKLHISEYDIVREWLAKNANEGSVLIRWYLEEMEEDIADLIITNKHFPEEAKVPLKISIFKKRKMISILQKAGVKNSLEVLQELLEVINK